MSNSISSQPPHLINTPNILPIPTAHHMYGHIYYANTHNTSMRQIYKGFISLPVALIYDMIIIRKLLHKGPWYIINLDNYDKMRSSSCVIILEVVPDLPCGYKCLVVGYLWAVSTLVNTIWSYMVSPLRWHLVVDHGMSTMSYCLSTDNMVSCTSLDTCPHSQHTLYKTSTPNIWPHTWLYANLSNVYILNKSTYIYLDHDK